ncbi:MAG: hypothetical protein WCF12_12875 [Propionicimonas sp.]
MSPEIHTEAVVLELPGKGRWQARNSPARRIPSHGTHLFGTTYAIDLVPVDHRGRSGAVTWRTLLAAEQPTAFSGFGRPVAAPIAGTVVLVHDGEPDHVAHRSPVASLGYALGQPGRVRQGWAAVAGNSTQPHVHLQVTDSLDWPTTRGVPLAFREYRSVATGQVVSGGIPAEAENIEPA